MPDPLTPDDRDALRAHIAQVAQLVAQSIRDHLGDAAAEEFVDGVTVEVDRILGVVTDLTFEQYQRASWQTYETTIRALLDTGSLTLNPLYLIREQLVRGHWNQPESLPNDVQARRLVLLNDVAVALTDAHGWDAWPFPGDLLPAAPDDLTSADGPDRG